MVNRFIKIGLLGIAFYLLCYFNLVVWDMIINQLLSIIYEPFEEYTLEIFGLIIPGVMLFIPLILDWIFPTPRTSALSNCFDMGITVILFKFADTLVYNLGPIFTRLPFVEVNPLQSFDDPHNNLFYLFIKLSLVLLFVGQLSVDVSRFIRSDALEK